MKHLINVRKRNRVFGDGKIDFLKPANRCVLAYIRSNGTSNILCVANLSRMAQPVLLNLQNFKGHIPIEMLGSNFFPIISSEPYQITLPGYGFYWFELSEKSAITSWKIYKEPDMTALPVLVARVSSEQRVLSKLPKVLADRNEIVLKTEVLPQYLSDKRWFAGKGKEIVEITFDVSGSFAFKKSPESFLAIFSVHFFDGTFQKYFLPFYLKWEMEIFNLSEISKWLLSKVRQKHEIGYLIDSIASDDFCFAVLAAINEEQEISFSDGKIRFWKTPILESLINGNKLVVKRPGVEQSHMSIFFSEKLVLKFYRQVQEGENPELEIGKFLTDQKSFQNIAKVAGAIEFVKKDGRKIVLGILQEFIENQNDVWNFTINYLGRFFEGCMRYKSSVRATKPEKFHETYTLMMRNLGIRIGEMHLALNCKTDNPAFIPEEISDSEWQEWEENFNISLNKAIFELESKLEKIPIHLHPQVKRLIENRNKIEEQVKALLPQHKKILKLRCHGDLHLGQILIAANDFVVIDFEGEPSRTLEEKRQKQSPLRDVAGLVRSFSYAARMSLKRIEQRCPEYDLSILETKAEQWEKCAIESFLKGYLSITERSPFLPENILETRMIIQLFCIEKALYEVFYELHNRPDWIDIPLFGLLSYLKLSK